MACRPSSSVLPALILLPLLLLLATAAAAATAEVSQCHCGPANCLCCVQLNLTQSVDLGGPACANVRQSRGNVTINLSYADNEPHNATIALDGAARKPTCMNLLSDLAQICAKFTSMGVSRKGAAGDAYTGCLVIEPALLGSPQATYPLGCFEFDQGQVRQVQRPAAAASSDAPAAQAPSGDEEEDDEQGIDAEELLAVVSASAEQGIAFFTRWLGINLAGGVKPNVSSAASTPITPGDKRAGRTVSILFDGEDKSDEKLKRLLSAQDNVVKESATIGDSSNGQGTVFFYPQHADAKSSPPSSESVATISPENLAIVSSESRRGGRAYNIHQHVNEV